MLQGTTEDIRNKSCTCGTERNPMQSHPEDRPVEDSCARSYPHVRHGGRGVEELADDVGGGGDAEEDGADDLLPPGQQQHGILPPATPTSCFIPLDQANGSVALLPVDVAVGEVVAVVWKERVKKKKVVVIAPAQ